MYNSSTRLKTKRGGRLSGIAGGALTLAAAGMIAKLLGAIYRIPLTNILGAQGMGMYQLVFPIYALMLTLSSSSIPTAISRLISEKRAIGDTGGKYRVMKTSAILLLVSGGVATLVLYLLSTPLANLQGIGYIRFGYYAVAPSVLLVACSSFFKGWFQGNMNMIPTASAQIVEQIAKMLFGLLFAKLLLPRGLVYGVVGALIGLTLSELISLLVMAILYLTQRQSGQPKIKVKLSDAGEIIRVSLPIALSGLIFPLIQFVDSLLIVNLLRFSGVDAQIATAQYGILTGTVNPLINMPIVITLALAVAIVPIVSARRVKKDASGIKEKGGLSIKLAYIIGIPCAVGCALIAEPVVRLLYPSLSESQLRLSAALLAVSSISIIFLSSLQIHTSLLQALGKTMLPVRNLAIAAVVKICLDIVLILNIGIMGGAVASIVTYIVAALLNTHSYNRLVGRDKKMLKSISKILLYSVIMGAIVVALRAFVRSSLAVIILSVSLGGAIYGALVLFGGVLSDEELVGFPFGRGLKRLRDRRGADNDKGNRSGN